MTNTAHHKAACIEGATLSPALLEVLVLVFCKNEMESTDTNKSNSSLMDTVIANISIKDIPRLSLSATHSVATIRRYKMRTSLIRVKCNV